VIVLALRACLNFIHYAFAVSLRNQSNEHFSLRENCTHKHIIGIRYFYRIVTIRNDYNCVLRHGDVPLLEFSNIVDNMVFQRIRNSTKCILQIGNMITTNILPLSLLPTPSLGKRLLAFLVLALLVSDTAACLASRLARCLALTATAVLCAFAKVTSFNSFDMFHSS
jgi:hypothetical protein